MTSKILKNRWIGNNDAKEALDEIKLLFRNGGMFKNEHSPFGLTKDGLIDFRGIDLRQQQIKKIKIKNIDLSHSQFGNAWIENSVFETVNFENVDFTEISERGNLFHNVKFSNCKFNKAGIGYEGSQYLHCLIEKSSFTKTVFIRGEFVNTQFIDCKLKGVDFNASSFENCSFVGRLEDVWFRGGYAYPSDDANFGKAKKNQMRNVSFSGAILEGVNFSNGCDLSTVQLPSTNNYILFNNWEKRLEHLKEVIKEWSTPQRKEAEIFSSSFLVHAKTQDWFIVNIEELQRDFGVDVASNIIIELNKKTL
ncbi:MAG: hypothetical protein PHI03_13790 [Bacteroidales bacterium]|nr:hypothetical protein [Bacteroidales bacterium]